MLLDTQSDNLDLSARKGGCFRTYAFVCHYCGMVHIETPLQERALTQSQAARQAREAGWIRRRGAWYCASCHGMHRFVQEEEPVMYRDVPPVGERHQKNGHKHVR